jgi:BA14K-like protein
MVVDRNRGLQKFNDTTGTRFSRHGLRTWALPFVLALGCCIAAPGAALARTQYNGDWSVLIATRRGACEPALRYGVQIADGAVFSDSGGAATVEGRVSPAGATRVTVRSGNAWAVGFGHLSSNSGSGIWRGKGSSGACSGTWVARRSGNYASELNPPRSATAPAAEASGHNVAYCEERLRSYDRATETYLGYDGARHRCLYAHMRLR